MKKRRGATQKHHCVVCKEMKATLQLDDTDWICEDCAQHMSDMGNEMEAEARDCSKCE